MHISREDPHRNGEETLIAAVPVVTPNDGGGAYVQVENYRLYEADMRRVFGAYPLDMLEKLVAIRRREERAEHEPPFEVRPTGVPGEEGQIDEIVTGPGWRLHIEQMSDTGYMLMFSAGDYGTDDFKERRFWFGSKSGRAAVELVEPG